MEELDMHSPDLTARNIDAIAQLFPTVITEALDIDGNPKRGIDWDLLRQELSDHVVDGPQERYQLNWPGKREALFAANAPIAKTLRPMREESVEFDTTKNLFIEGDNLDALKLLQESYLGKIKLIYISTHLTTLETISFTMTTSLRPLTNTLHNQVKSTKKERAWSQILSQMADSTQTGYP